MATTTYDQQQQSIQAQQHQDLKKYANCCIICKKETCEFCETTGSTSCSFNHFDEMLPCLHQVHFRCMEEYCFLQKGKLIDCPHPDCRYKQHNRYISTIREGKCNACNASIEEFDWLSRIIAKEVELPSSNGDKSSFIANTRKYYCSAKCMFLNWKRVSFDSNVKK